MRVDRNDSEFRDESEQSINVNSEFCLNGAIPYNRNRRDTQISMDFKQKVRRMLKLGAKLNEKRET